MKYDKDTMLYEHFQYNPLKHNEAEVIKKVTMLPKRKLELVDNKTFLGIEVEVEGMALKQLSPGHDDLRLTPLWIIKTDGSLRNNGREFISPPIRGQNAVAAIHLLHDYLNEFHQQHKFSERTSVHVHMNVRKLTIEQVISLLFVYLSVEKSIFKFIKSGGWDRSNNIFCVALGESDFYVGLHLIMKYLRQGNIGDIMTVIQQMWRKYTAFNTLPIADKGTFEFRHMGGTIDCEVLINWINLLLLMKKYAETHSLEDIIKTISNLNVNSQYEQYLTDIFGEHAHLVSGGNIKSDLEEGVCVVKDILIWAQDEEYPKDTKEFEGSAMYQFLSKRFDLKFMEANLQALQDELMKLKTTHSKLYKEAHTEGIDKKIYINMMGEMKDIDIRINEIEQFLGISRPYRGTKIGAGPGGPIPVPAQPQGV